MRAALPSPITLKTTSADCIPPERTMLDAFDNENLFVTLIVIEVPAVASKVKVAPFKTRPRRSSVVSPARISVTFSFFNVNLPDKFWLPGGSGGEKLKFG